MKAFKLPGSFSPVLLLLLLGHPAVVSTVHAQAVLLDDFADGIDPLWFPLDSNYELDAMGMPTGPKPWGPGIFDASSGALNLRTTGPVPPDPALPPGPSVFDPLNSGLLSLAWVPSLPDPTFSHGRLRATIRADGPSNLDLVLRGDPATMSSYAFSALGSYGQFGFFRNDNGLIARAELVPGLTFTQGEDWVMEFQAVGDQFSMKAWRVGDPEPAAPQLTVVDGTHAAGGLGVFANLYTNNIAVPTPVNATFDNVYFTAIPEPSSVISALIGATMLAALAHTNPKRKRGQRRARSPPKRRPAKWGPFSSIERRVVP